MVLNSAAGETIIILQLPGQEAIRSWIKVVTLRYRKGAFARGPVEEELVMNWESLWRGKGERWVKNCWMHLNQFLL